MSELWKWMYVCGVLGWIFLKNEDWFSSSKDEQNEMYLNKAIIDSTAIANRGSGFGRNFYWSLTEYGADKVYWQYFFNGVQEKDEKRASLKCTGSSSILTIYQFNYSIILQTD